MITPLALALLVLPKLCPNCAAHLGHSFGRTRSASGIGVIIGAHSLCAPVVPELSFPDYAPSVPRNFDFVPQVCLARIPTGRNCVPNKAIRNTMR